MPTFQPDDPFHKAREESGILPGTFRGEEIPMILRWHDVRRAAKDFGTFTSDTPFRVPIPSEEDVRRYRQLPIETDPPEHTEYRDLIEPLFARAAEAGYVARIEGIIAEQLEEAAGLPSVEIVSGFALPLQCQALAVLLNVPGTEAAIWRAWGTHVFSGPDREEKGRELERYLHRMFDEAAAEPRDDFFGILTRARFRGRALTRDELMGFGNLVFAGGRDTVINLVTAAFGYLAEHPEALAALRADPRLVFTAAEELTRVVAPVTHLGRTCPHGAPVAGHEVKPGQRVALTWASANFDASVFACPHEVKLDRKPNPHLAYGFGAHACIGAAHARTVIRGVLRVLARRAAALEILAARMNRDNATGHDRHAPYEELVLRITLREA